MRGGGLVECVHEWRYSGPWTDSMREFVEPAERCDRPQVLHCVRCAAVVSRRCGSSRARVCEPCSASYKGRVARLVRAGTRGQSRESARRKGQRAVWSKTGLFVTVTAVGDDVHWITDRRGRPVRMCTCTPPGGVDLAKWNAGASQRWRMLIQRIRRDHGRDVEYLRVVEVQERGALHYHVVFRRRSGAPLRMSRAYVRRVAMGLGFGHDVDVRPYAVEHARYVAKYVAKAADERPDVPWDGRRWVVNEVHGGRWPIRTHDANYRTWVASRGYGDTMAQVKADQAHWGRVWHELPAWGPPDGVGAFVAFPGDERYWLGDEVPVRPDIWQAVGRDPVLLTL